MKSEIIQMESLTLVGLVATGACVGEIDIAGLWARFITQSETLKHQVNPDKGYEFHGHIEDPKPRHFTLIGAEVDRVSALPIEMFAKLIPSGTYARFTHQFKEGGFGEAFKKVYGWVEESEYNLAYPFDIQVYDNRFKGPEDPESVIEILVPLKKE